MSSKKKQRNKPIVDFSIIPLTINYSTEAERVASQLVGKGSIHFLGCQMVVEASTEPDFRHGCAIRWNNLRDPGNPSKQLMIQRCFDTDSVDNGLHFIVDLVDVVYHDQQSKNVQ